MIRLSHLLGRPWFHVLLLPSVTYHFNGGGSRKVSLLSDFLRKLNSTGETLLQDADSGKTAASHSWKVPVPNPHVLGRGAVSQAQNATTSTCATDWFSSATMGEVWRHSAVSSAGPLAGCPPPWWSCWIT